jgi:hypothetical protein
LSRAARGRKEIHPSADPESRSELAAKHLLLSFKQLRDRGVSHEQRDLLSFAMRAGDLDLSCIYDFLIIADANLCRIQGLPTKVFTTLIRAGSFCSTGLTTETVPAGANIPRI